MKNKIDIYIEKTLFDSIEVERKTLPRSAFLEKVIDENIDTVKPDNAETIHSCVYINNELYQKIIKKTGNRKIATFVDKIIKWGMSKYV